MSLDGNQAPGNENFSATGQEASYGHANDGTSPRRTGMDPLGLSAANFSNYRDYPRFDADSTDDARAPITSDRIRPERMIVYQGPTNEYDNGAPEFNGSNVSDFLARWDRHARRNNLFGEEKKDEMLWYCGETQRDIIEGLPEFMASGGCYSEAKLYKTLKDFFKAGDRKQQQMTMGFLRALTSDGTPTGFRSYLMTFHRISDNLLRTGVIGSNMERAKLFLRGLHQKAFDKITRLHEVSQDDPSTFNYAKFYETATDLCKKAMIREENGNMWNDFREGHNSSPSVRKVQKDAHDLLSAIRDPTKERPSFDKKTPVHREKSSSVLSEEQLVNYFDRLAISMAKAQEQSLAHGRNELNPSCQQTGMMPRC